MGVPRTATDAEIKTAHRKLARKYHPDLNKDPTAEARFKDIGEAYQVLKDPEKRAAFDALGTGFKDGDEIRPPQSERSGGFDFNGGQPHDAHDFFSDLFGERPRGRPSQARGRQQDWPGEDLHAKISIKLADTYNGAQRAFTLQIPVLDARGQLTYQPRTLDVSIPKGILDGQRLRLAGQGGPGLGNARAGDLYLEVTVEKDKRFAVDGRNVTLGLPVAPWEAALGATVNVPTPSGPVDMTIPANSPAGRRLRLKGRGIPGNPPGDLYVTLEIVLPLADTDEKKAAYETLRKAFKFDPRAHFHG
jgi:curved DNA-binding protein